MENRLNKLEEAMTNMLNTQAALGSQTIALSERQAKSEAAFLQQMASFSERQAKSEAAFIQQMASFSERQAKSEAAFTQQLASLVDILHEHTRILNNLPNAIKEKIGFTR
jgi:ABC-type transporter Mla subunit MlaD